MPRVIPLPTSGIGSEKKGQIEMLKTFLFVGVAAGVGGWAGDKLYALVDPKLPASVGPSLRSGARLGMQAGTGVIVYGVLRAMF